MSSAQTKKLSPFGLSALELDSNFAELERLSNQVSRLTLESENDLNRGIQYLTQFGECGKQIGDGIQKLSETLNEKRIQAEHAAQLVSEQSILIQKRRAEYDLILERYRELTNTVHKASEVLSKFKKSTPQTLTDEEKRLLPNHLAELNAVLEPLLDEAKKLKGDAHQAKMRSLERNIDSLSQSLEAARRKLAYAIENPMMR